MKRVAAALTITGIILLAACSSRDNDMNTLPGPADQTVEPPQPVSPPRAPDAGTYNGLQDRYGPRPPQSGLNSDPANPNGAPGTR